MSLAALEALIAGSRCAARWSSGRPLVAKVFSPNGVDIGRRLVSAGGWRTGGTRGIVAAENEARKARRGMWRGTFVKPWEGRASSPRRAPEASMISVGPGRNGSRPDRDCAIVCTSGSGGDVGPALVRDRREVVGVGRIWTLCTFRSAGCQRRREDASPWRSKNASGGVMTRAPRGALVIW